jgi:hypothetical protein
MRPCGDERSSPVILYVGHTGRQKPHEMQVESRSGSKMPRVVAPAAPVGNAGALTSRAFRG